MKQFLAGMTSMALFAGANIFASAGTDANWPQWRGPHQDGVAPLANPPREWNESNHVKWKVPLPGEGAATPMLWQDRIFIEAAIPTGKKIEATKPAEAEPSTNSAASTEPPRRGGKRGGRGGGEKPTEYIQFALLALDRSSGKTIWKQVAREEVPHEGYRPGDGTFASTSGLTDGSNVFAYFGSHGLYCYDFSGKQKWSHDLGKMRVQNTFGEGSSPTCYGDTLVVNWDNEDNSYIAAFDKNTGKELWKTPREEHTSWSTPLVVAAGGRPTIVTDATKKIRAYDLATGKLLWATEGLTRNVIPSPVADGERVYCMSGFQGNALFAIKLAAAKGDTSSSDAIAWSYKKSTPYVPSPLLYNGRLYFLASNNGRLSCLDAKTGNVLIDAESIEDIPNVYASPLGAAGRVYIAGRNGTTVVLKDGDKLEKLAVNKLDDNFDASPIAAGKDLILRGRKSLYCLSE
jgi:outer membrane protein assembly factor BamB